METCLINVAMEVFEESYGLERIATYLRANHKRVSIHEIKQVKKTFIRVRPDYQVNNPEIYMQLFNELQPLLPKKIGLFGFTLYISNAHIIYAITKIIKHDYPDARICLGGKLVTNSYKQIFDDCSEVDFIIRGDGEEPLLEVINALENHRGIDDIRSVVTRNNIGKNTPIATFDINKIKYVERDLVNKNAKNYLACVYGSRGCTASCTFCEADFTKKWVGRSVRDIFDEIRTLHEKYGYRFFDFIDSTFNDPGQLGEQRIKELCALILEYPEKLSFHCYLRANRLHEKDIDMLKLMKQAGFSQVYVGIESGNNKDLELYGKRATVADNNRAMKLLSDVGITTIIGFIMYHPLSDEKTIAENYRFLAAHHENRLKNYINQLHIYHHTPIYNYFKERGIMDDNHSYLKPYNYNFQNEFVRQMHQFLEYLNKQKNNVLKLGEDFFWFGMIFNSLMTLYPEHSAEYLKVFRNIQQSLANIFSDYFYKLYVKNDLAYGYRNLDFFEKDVTSVYKQAQNLKLRLMAKKPFSDLFVLNY